MLRRCLATLLCALAFGASGCIEMQQTITLNPDGRGKVAYDIVQPIDIDFGQGAGQADQPLEQKKQKAIAKILTRRGVTAWKDVAADWTKDGRLHVKATAYFERLEDLSGENTDQNFALKREPDGTMKISVKLAKDSTNKKLPDLAKMTDHDLDDYIMKRRVEYQAGKPLLIAMLSDLKMGIVFQLPGDVQAAKGFKKDGDRRVAIAIDGNAVLKDINSFMAQDNAAFKKKIKDAKSLDLAEAFGVGEALREPEITVANAKEPLFDYDKEVKEARAAYSALRKQLGLDAKVKLPGE